MRLETSVLTMFLGSIFIGFFISSSLMINSIADIRPSLTKFYLAVWMALWMVLLEFTMFNVPPIMYIGVFTLLIIVFVSARRQIFVTDNQYLQAMIQHHSSAILTSKEIAKKTRDKNVKNLAQAIIDSQQSEIDYMNNLIYQ